MSMMSRTALTSGRAVRLMAAAAAATALVSFGTTTASAAPREAAAYGNCPVGSFCLYNLGEGGGDMCSWTESDANTHEDNCFLANKNSNGTYWLVRSVYNNTGVTVEYYTATEFNSRVGSTTAHNSGNLAGTYTVGSLKFE